MNFSRMQLGRFIRIITGHNNLLYHRSNTNPDIDQTCRFCDETRETFIHLFSDCPMFWRQQQEASSGLQPGEPLYLVDPQKILDFSYTPRINEALESEGEVRRVWDAEQSVDDISMEELESLGGDQPDGGDGDDPDSSGGADRNSAAEPPTWIYLRKKQPQPEI